ncbi:hypothetical protein N9051_00325 [Akkermansiaceae bacterium]|nr:hypothetical protein [Akkermansiaceae bacterium]
MKLQIMRVVLYLGLLGFLSLFLSSCASSPIDGGIPGNMGNSPAPSVRKAQIAAEPRGDFYYGRRYYVKKTRFWGYLREPGKSARSAKLVIFNESQKKNPDRIPENGPAGRRYGFDHNYEYKIYGRYTGRTLYEPNSNQFLPEFELSRYELVDSSPGWLFSPSDSYSPTRVTLHPSF